MKPFRPALAILVALSAMADAQLPDTFKYTLFSTSPVPQGFERQGASVAVDGDLAVVGAPRARVLVNDSGVVKVYNLASATPTVPVLLLKNPTPANNDQFGYAVAISGTRIAVGAYLDDTGALNAGSVYIFDTTSATPTVPVFTLNNPAPSPAEDFGISVGISGTRVVVGAHLDNTGANAAGIAYVYDLSSGTPTTPVLTLLNPSPANSDHFGFSVAISGTKVVVGAYQDDTNAMNAGSVYVYDVTSGNVPIHTINNPAGVSADGDNFGYAVAISGNRVAVGEWLDDNGMQVRSGSMHVFDLSSGTPTVPVLTAINPTPAGDDHFGEAVSISGTRIAVGTSRDNGLRGAAYIYDLTSGTPTIPTVTMINPNPAVGDLFGNAVAISGARVVVGAIEDDTSATQAGSAYVYNLSSGTPNVPTLTLDNPSPQTEDLFGSAVAVSGSRVVIGAISDDRTIVDGGAAYVFDLASATPAIPIAVLTKPGAVGFENFGVAVAISGTRVVVGANVDDGVGRAYVFDLASATPTVPVATLTNPSPDFDNFGLSVGISGTRVVVGAPLANTTAEDAGRAYVYDIASGTPTVPIGTLSGTSEFENFGNSVAISGPLVVVGSPAEDTGGEDAGSAYVYDFASGTPLVPIATLHNPSSDGVAFDNFGLVVAISGMRVAVSAYQDDVGAVGAGTVFAYDPASATPLVPTHELNNPAPSEGLGFGQAIAISGSTVLVGVGLDASFFAGGPKAYVYNLAGQNPETPAATLNNPNTGAVGDGYGLSVGLDAGNAVIGALYNDISAVDKGAAYVFGPGALGPFSQWRLTHLGNASADPLDDPDLDGLTTLAEYGVNTLPQTPSVSPVVPTLFTYAEGKRLRVFVPRDPAHNDITVEVRAASSPAGPWTTIASSVLGAPFSGAGYVSGDSATPGLKTVEIRDIVNLSGNPVRFLHVQTTY